MKSIQILDKKLNQENESPPPLFFVRVCNPEIRENRDLLKTRICDNLHQQLCFIVYNWSTRPINRRLYSYSRIREHRDLLKTRICDILHQQLCFIVYNWSTRPINRRLYSYSRILLIRNTNPSKIDYMSSLVCGATSDNILKIKPARHSS